jgi:hypothetical protein
MKNESQCGDGIEIIAGVLLRCFMICVVFVSLWFFLYIFGGEAGYKAHAALFQISKHEYELMHYYGIGLMKIFNFTFFLIPYLAIKWALKRKA